MIDVAERLEKLPPQCEIGSFCRRWKIHELSFFGSVLRDDFGPASDIDVLVSFDDDAQWSLWDFTTMQDELGALFGRKVDLVERQVEIIGEAARRVSREFQDAHPEFPGGQFRHSGTFWRTITVKSNMIGSGVWQLNMFQP